MTESIKVYGIEIDSACAALLRVALEASYPDERKRAIDRMGQLGCNEALGVVAVKAQYPDERKRAIDLIGRD